MKLCNGAFHSGPFKKHINESKTQALSSSIIEFQLNCVRIKIDWKTERILINIPFQGIVCIHITSYHDNFYVFNTNGIESNRMVWNGI